MSTAHATPLTTYKAEYVILQGKKTVGKGTRALRQLADGRYQLSQQSDIRLFFYKDRRQESARFSWLGSRLQPEQYRYSQDTTFKDREVEISFAPPGANSQGGTIAGRQTEGPIRLDWQEGLLDPLSYQQQMAFDLGKGKTELDYRFVKDNGTRHYQFKVIGPERIRTPFGTIDSIRVDRVKQGGSDQTQFWLWPERDYLLVRLARLKNGKSIAELQLTALSNL